MVELPYDCTVLATRIFYAGGALEIDLLVVLHDESELQDIGSLLAQMT